VGEVAVLGLRVAHDFGVEGRRQFHMPQSYHMEEHTLARVGWSGAVILARVLHATRPDLPDSESVGFSGSDLA